MDVASPGVFDRKIAQKCVCEKVTDRLAIGDTTGYAVDVAEIAVLYVEYVDPLPGVSPPMP
jgi:hypothetical protein